MLIAIVGWEIGENRQEMKVERCKPKPADGVPAKGPEDATIDEFQLAVDGTVANTEFIARRIVVATRSLNDAEEPEQPT